MLDLFHSDRIQAHIICPCCDDEILENEDCTRIKDILYHTVCIEDMDRIELLQMVGIDVEQEVF